ncbi:hypothetical protein ACFQ64_19630 [Streptomyces sp. NPDC056460]|uniref:hypothetical protein n=1 Tax=Streptomyces sp. NPDC056460 TaxID=3345825 RepID=UPI00368A8A86
MRDRQGQGSIAIEQNTVLGNMGTANWSAEDATAYEVALEGINHVVGAYSGLIAQARAAGDAERAQALTGEQGAWAAKRKGLTPADRAGVGAVASDCTETLNRLRGEA